MDKIIVNGIHEGNIVSVPLIVENGEMKIDPASDLNAVQRSWLCKLNMHVWDGNRCVNCGRVR